MNSFTYPWDLIQSKILQACERAQRNFGLVKLLAVSKSQSSEAIRQVYALGCRDFGENYVQEWVEKQNELKDLSLNWHLIGHLQSNKVKKVVGHCKLIHSVDSLALARTIDRQAETLRICQPVLLQLNLGGEVQKWGYALKTYQQEKGSLARLEHVQIQGFMLIPPLAEDPEKNRALFRQLKCLLDEANQHNDFPTPLSELSMGMSHDFEIAIEEGATWVRLGTALFGARA
ncbi:MAG: YggS family pyridoxal phosphate-dependent enzyme [Deltaproteobacteria bacterium]|nr:YggS family pyridoxal phosphate-dependent enzyme [Deltaproteobacteria bacterium]